MHGDVGAVLEDRRQNGRRNGVVDDQRQAEGVRLVGPGSKIDDVQLRVADRLGEDESRLVVDQFGQSLRLVGVGPTYFDAVLRQCVREQVVGAAVES